MIQPTKGEEAKESNPELFAVGCVGRVVQYAEIGDGRCFLTLMGVTRFRVAEELTTLTPYRMISADYRDFALDFIEGARRSLRRPRRAGSGVARPSPRPTG